MMELDSVFLVPDIFVILDFEMLRIIQGIPIRVLQIPHEGVRVSDPPIKGPAF